MPFIWRHVVPIAIPWCLFHGVLLVAAALVPVGSFPNAASHYGTFDQGGNAWEWIEATVFDTQRMLRGGAVFGSHEKMLSVIRSSASPTRRYQDVGFRVGRSVPVEPPPAAAN